MEKVEPVRLWDPVVRLTHWGIAAVVLVNAVLSEGGSVLHVWAGWIGLGLLLLRLVWGLVGSEEARLTGFLPAPRAALSHLAAVVAGRPRDYRGHNPAGAIMVWALWATLAVLIGTGLTLTGGRTPVQIAADQAAVAAGDWSVLVGDGASAEDDEGKAMRHGIEDVHKIAGNLILVMVLLHVAGVAVESRALRRNLVAPMLFGGRK